MTEQAADTVIGMSDADLAVHPTVYAPGSFQGKTVLISGAAGGLGRAAAWLLGRLGARLILVGRKQDRLDSLATALAEKEIVAETIALDIRQQGDVQDLFRHVREKFGQLDLLINSAGGQFPQAAIDFSEKGWNAVIATNLTGTWFMMQAAAQFWRDTESKGSIVNIVVVTRHEIGRAHV